MKLLSFALVLIAVTSNSTSLAATLSYRVELDWTPSPDAIIDLVPRDTKVYKFYVTTDADILSVDNVKVSLSKGALFQVAPPFGSDVEPPPPEFIALYRPLEVDSWITTPGATVLLGTGLPGDGTGSWGDLVDSGPQLDFQFAQLAMPRGELMAFSGRVNLAGARGPEHFAFDFVSSLVEPEPAALSLVSLGVIGVACMGRYKRSR